MPQPNKREYFNVATSQSASGEATLYLYGYIGQDRWWEDDPTEPLTDMAIVKAIAEIEAQGCTRLNVRINSPGGSIYHGDAIISAIQRTSCEVHGYIDGMAASMAGMIWMACPNRHMASHGKFMAHAAEGIVWGNAADMRNEANTLDVFDAGLIEIMAKACGMSTEEVKSNYFDGKDHWFTAANCVELGLIEQTEDYSGELIPDDVEKMNYRDLVRKYANTTPPHPPKRNNGSILQDMRANIRRSLFGVKQEPTAIAVAHADPPTPAAIPELIQQSTTMDMNELKNSVAKGEITPDQLADYLNANGYQVEKKPDTGDRIAALEQSILNMGKTIEEALKNFGAAPGAGATRVAANGNEGKEADAYEEYQNKMAQLALSGDKVQFDN